MLEKIIDVLFYVILTPNKNRFSFWYLLNYYCRNWPTRWKIVHVDKSTISDTFQYKKLFHFRYFLMEFQSIYLIFFFFFFCENWVVRKFIENIHSDFGKYYFSRRWFDFIVQVGSFDFKSHPIKLWNNEEKQVLLCPNSRITRENIGW
jgi:hypothetical protein